MTHELSDRSAIAAYSGAGLFTAWQWMNYNALIVGTAMFVLFAISIFLNFTE